MKIACSVVCDSSRRGQVDIFEGDQTGIKEERLLASRKWAVQGSAARSAGAVGGRLVIPDRRKSRARIDLEQIMVSSVTLADELESNITALRQIEVASMVPTQPRWTSQYAAEVGAGAA